MSPESNFTIRRAGQRGHANHGWLDSWHTFSFADYYDPKHMGFRSLRVINDDRVAGGGGFPTHPHRDMEIFSYVLAGRLAHKDSMGNSRVMMPGEIQLMRAGSGVMHSEFNPSAIEPAHFLQIWIQPNQKGLDPSYTEWTPTQGQEHESKTLVISSDGRDGSASIAQDASIYLLKLQHGTQTTHQLLDGRGLWLHVAKGALTLNGVLLEAGDAAALESSGDLVIVGTAGDTEAILFDLK
ncbi:MAG: pirin family protein [Akkermansiaceae bacterium]|nr:pirin family protein [Akkermansiaceae bacterium]